MATDKYSAVWVSHSSIRDFLTCPRAYFLRNVYKDSITGRKITLTSPALTLGQAVHEILESLSVLPTNKRFEVSLLDLYERSWQKYTGKLGGFFDQETEQKYKNRGREMLTRVQKNPGPLKNLAVKINMDLPHFWLSEDEGIILCGKIDWLEYMKDSDSVHVIDFKTGKQQEDSNSLQLPIYHLLVHYCQKRKVEKASYWYLEFSDKLSEKELPDIAECEQEILDVAKKVKLARQLRKFDCPNGKEGCHACRGLELVLKGEGELVGTNDFNVDVYVLDNRKDEEEDSFIL